MARCAAIFLITLLLVPFGGRADAERTRFSVRAVLPQNQMDAELSYFYLEMQPNQTQTLRVSIRNDDSRDIFINVQANTAFSNASGTIDYSASQGRNTENGIDFQSLITLPESRVLVPAHGQAYAEFVLQMPEEGFDGELLGGLVFTREEEPEEAPPKSETTGGMKVRHVFNYCIAVRLTQGRPIPQEADEPKLMDVQIGEKAGFPALIVLANNAQPRILKDMRMDIHLYPQNANNAVVSFKDLTVSMAPYSTMPYTILLREENALQPGSYRALVTLQLEEEIWNYETMLVSGA